MDFYISLKAIHKICRRCSETGYR